MSPQTGSQQPRPTAPRQRRAILRVQKTLAGLDARKVKEAETCAVVEEVLTRVLGYDPFLHLRRQHPVRGIGSVEFVDFAIMIDPQRDPAFLVEVKALGTALGAKSLAQVVNYGLHTPCDWVILTNGRQWQLHWIDRTRRKPDPQLVLDWDLSDQPGKLLEQLQWVSYHSVRKGVLKTLEVQTQVLARENLLNAVFGQKVLTSIRGELRRYTGHSIAMEHLKQGLRRLLEQRESSVPGDPRGPDGPRLSMLDAAEKVLRRARRPLACREIVDQMKSQGLWASPRGKTPVQTLRAALKRDIESDEPRFVRVSRGKFGVAT